MMTSFIFGNMLQHMQYTVDKRVYFLYSALLKPQNSNNNNNNQLPPCLPSQRLPESASALTTQLLLRRWLWSVLALWCMQLSVSVCAAGGLEEPYRAHSKLVLCTPKKEGGHFRQGAHCTSHCTHNPADSLVPFHRTLTPEHRTTSAATHLTASPPRWTVWKLSSSTSNCV